tara:strand:- start:354 stop:635 length:282 start_codon:yes stop_codon:yes gene_type:complete
MKVTKTDTTAVNFDNSVYTNTYVSNWSGEVEFKFSDEFSDGTEYKLSINVPIETARSILAELQTDIEGYDKYLAEKAEQEAAKKAEESQESDS